MNTLLKGLRNSLCKFSGEDYAIIRECSTKIQLYFSLIGLFVLLILLFCFLSAVYFTERLFHNPVLDIGVGLVWGYIITNMYVLLLYTITPTLLPKKERRKSVREVETFSLNFSMLLRIVMVILLAIIIAQPLNIFILIPSSENLAEDIRILFAHNFWAWIFTILMVGIFLLPVYWKYRIRKIGEFYGKKRAIKKRFIEDNYEEFKKSYIIVLESSIVKCNEKLKGNLLTLLDKLKEINEVNPNKKREEAYQNILNELNRELDDNVITKYEYWADPPYRTVYNKKSQRVLSEQDLLNHIYSETD